MIEKMAAVALAIRHAASGPRGRGRLALWKGIPGKIVLSGRFCIAQINALFWERLVRR